MTSSLIFLAQYYGDSTVAPTMKCRGVEIDFGREAVSLSVMGRSDGMLRNFINEMKITIFFS